MKCPSCGGFQTFVTLSKNSPDETSRKRRYRCDICGCRFNTIEVVSKKDEKGEADADH